MIKQSIFSLLLLCSLSPSIQAEETKQPVQTELTEQARLDIVDDAIAFAAGYGGAYLSQLLALLLSRYAINDMRVNCGSSFIGLILYGLISRKLAVSEDHQKKMFGRGAVVGIFSTFSRSISFSFR